jgi:hypothetical protein
MKKLIFLLGVAAAAYFVAWPQVKVKFFPPYTDLARTRAQNLLEAMAGTSNPKLGVPDQYGTAVWSMNKISLDRDELDHFSPLYDDFRTSRKLFRRIQTYEILDVTDVSTKDGRCATVRIKIDGNKYTWNVPENLPIGWGS